MKDKKAKRKQDGGIGNDKKRKRTSKKKQNPSNNSINRMDEAFLRFPHLPEQILEELDFESLANARLVAISWEQFIDEREQRWHQIKDGIAELKKKCWGGKTPFHFACQNGQAGIAGIIMKDSAKLNIDLNAKDYFGMTAFHWVCRYACSHAHSKIVETIIKNSVKFNIDLNTKDNGGWTPFHRACSHDQLGKSL